MWQVSAWSANLRMTLPNSRQSSHRFAGRARARATAGAGTGHSRPKGLERRQAERDEAKLRAAAEQARDAAVAKRRQADRLSAEARTAADEATVAERAAVAAEEAVRAARAALDR